MSDAPTSAVLGFRPHTYWTAAVALAGPLEAPRVLERRRIVFADGDERFVFHQAAERGPEGAEALIARVRSATEARAAGEVHELIAALRNDGVAVRIAATAASVPAAGAFADILASHARIHAAEGSFYRDVVASACAVLGLEVRRADERELPAALSRRLEVDVQNLQEKLKQMGAVLGPPWTEDQKLATLAAWLQLEDQEPD